MRKCLRIAFSALLIIIFGVVVWLLRSQREPVYLGKPLSVVMRDLHAGGSDFEKRAAVRAMGTNVIPFVRTGLQRQDGPLKLKPIALAQKQTMIKLRFRTAKDGYSEAAGGVSHHHAGYRRRWGEAAVEGWHGQAANSGDGTS